MLSNDPQVVGGLSEAEATERLRRDGPNELPQERRHRGIALVAEIAGEPMILLLLACGVVYFLLGDPHEGLVLLASVLVVIGISLYQTQRTERALSALRDLSSPRALVIRDGRERRIAARELVRDDVARLREGDRIPADGVVLSTVHLEVDESLLTGESIPVRKVSGGGDLPPARPGGDGTPFVYSATLVVAGQGVFRVTATGPRTELGRIGQSLASVVETETPLQRQVAGAVKVLGALGMALCVLVAVLYGLGRGNWLEGALAGLALAISLMPEEFPVILTLFLALGAWRIARRNVLIRRMPALEALGATTVLCVDKTGTLTENRMRVAVVAADAPCWLPPDAPDAAAPEGVHRLLEFAVLASRENSFDPTEQAIHALAGAGLAGTEHLHRSWTLAREYPLSPALLAMSQVWRSTDLAAWTVAAKGAPEAVVDLCHLSDARRRRVADEAGALAGDGLRVLAVAACVVRAPVLPANQHDFSFEFLGLLGLSDPVRYGVPEAVAACRRAGIRIVMITGDYPATARAIAAQIGLAGSARVLTGADLDGMNDAELMREIAKVEVFARVVPEQKLRIVQALSATGDVVAMTGDGVNDAPALRAADIGIAMGKRGTDVAREAADLVLVDDDFASIVRAVSLGRRIYDNICKAMRYVVSIHIPIAGVSLIPVLFGWPLVLLPLHIVFLELIIDPACSVAFEAEPEEPDVMRRPPRRRDDRVLDLRALATAIAQGAIALAVLAALLAWMNVAGYPEQRARTIVFSALIVANLGLILTNRSASIIDLTVLHRRNWPLWAVMGGAAGVLTVVLSSGALRSIFRLEAPSITDVVLITSAAILSVLGFEIVKALGRHRATEIFTKEARRHGEH